VPPNWSFDLRGVEETAGLSRLWHSTLPLRRRNCLPGYLYYPILCSTAGADNPAILRTIDLQRAFLQPGACAVFAALLSFKIIHVPPRVPRFPGLWGFSGHACYAPCGGSGARPRETPYIQLWNSGVVIAPHAAREEKIGWVRRFRRIHILPTRLFFVRFVPHATDCHRAHRDCGDEAGFTARHFALGNLGTRLRSEHWGVPGQCLRLMSRNTLHSTPSFRRRSCTLLQQHCKSKAGPSGQKFRVASWLHSALFLPRPFFCSAVDCQPADIQLVNFCVYLPVIEFSGAGRLLVFAMRLSTEFA
jgi:hypothetical protein